MANDMATVSKLRFVTFLTLVRMPLVLLFFAGAIVNAEHPSPWLFWVSFLFLVLSAATDLFDGWLARRWDVVTEFGAHADPLMDKFFYLASFPLLVYVSLRAGHVPHAVLLLIMTLLFLSRDQWVTFLRSVGARYTVSGKAKWAGKLRTAVNFPLVCAIYYYVAAPPGFHFLPAALIHVFEAAALLINVVSVYTYTRDYWPYLCKSAEIKPPHSDKGENV